MNARVLENDEPLATYPETLGELFWRTATAAAARPFLLERMGDTWQQLTYGEAFEQARQLASAYASIGLSPNRPLLTLSPNSVKHALVILGAYLAGVPVAPVTSSYSTASQDFGRLQHILDVVRPGAIYVAPFAAHGRFAEVARARKVRLITDQRAPYEAVELDELLRSGAPATQLPQLGPDSIAKIMFTSGSTGPPKGVINTHRMLCANQQMAAQLWPELVAADTVLLDWLPWSHTFGGNKVFHLVLRAAATLYLDNGRPTETAFGATLRNLAEVRPTAYLGVPVAFELLLKHLSEDKTLRHRFFSRLRLMLFAAASLRKPVWLELQRLAHETTGRRIPLLTGWGTTETGPVATGTLRAWADPTGIGWPAPGVQIRLVPTGDATEIRVRGPNVTPGYYGDPASTAAAFDELGFFRTGDIGRLDAEGRTLVLEGRMAENFKLSSGTWVDTAAIRRSLLELGNPLIREVVVTAPNRDYLGALIWLANTADLCEPGDMRNATMEIVRQHNERSTGTSHRIRRVIIVAAPLDPDAHEITEKGYVNQLRVLANRTPLIDRLYAEPVSDPVLDLNDSGASSTQG